MIIADGVNCYLQDAEFVVQDTFSLVYSAYVAASLYANTSNDTGDKEIIVEIQEHSTCEEAHNFVNTA
jgi:hypothetical protein